MNEPERQDLVPWQVAIKSAKKHFIEIAKAEGNLVLYKKEAMFAMQALQKSEWLQGCDPHSIQNAVINVASIGLTLNPAHAYAYLVPRDGMACLDVSYKGLIKLATDSGSVLWAKAMLVYEDDNFEARSIALMPVHEFDPFKKERGEVIGGYCAAKLHDNSYLLDFMSREDLDNVRNTSKSKDSKYSPWNNWPEEMMKKTLIKRASKTWPNTHRLDQAVDIVNRHEGLDDIYINGTHNQISPEPVDAEKVKLTADQIKKWIDQDVIEETYDILQNAWYSLSNDERLRTTAMLKDKAPGCNKMYSTILKEYLDYEPKAD